MTARLTLWLGLVLAMVLPAISADALATLHVGNDAEPDTLDPHRAGSVWEFNVIGDFFLGLTTEDINAKPIPGAAESWTTTPDGLVWTFKLRPGLVWSDGVPLTASDFVFGFRRLLDPKTAARYAFIQYVVKNAEAVNTGKMPPEAVGVRAVDDRTLEITLNAPVPFLPGLLTHVTAYPIPEHVYKKVGEDWVKPGNMVTDGAYVLTEWTPHDHVTAVKNPKFYDAAHVAIDKVIYYPLESDAASLDRYRAGDIDISVSRYAFPIEDLPLVKKILPGQVHVAPYLANDYLVGNFRHSPFNDRRLIRAISLCLDRELLVDKVYRDGSLPAYSFVPPGIANYHGGAKLDFADWPMDKRRAEAKRLLAEAGYGPKHPLEFEYKQMTTHDGRREGVTESVMLKECGIIARLFFNESKVYYNAVQIFDFTFAWAGWVGDYNDPFTFLGLLDSNAGPYNYQGYNNPTYDHLLDAAQHTLDIDARAQILASAEQLALDDNAVIPLTFSTYRTLVGPQVRGYTDNPPNIHRTRWMSLVSPEAAAAP